MAARISDLPSLLKNLLQTTQDSTPDNPAEILNEFTGVNEVMGVSEVVSYPNQGHSGTYVYNNATAMWGKAQYS